MRVWISVHGRFHAFDLARELHRRGFLAGLATTYPRLMVRRFLPADVSLRTAPWLEGCRRISNMLPPLKSIERYVPGAFGRFASEALPRNADIFVGWSNASLEAINPARERGMKIIIERGSTHIQHQAEILSAAADETGIQCPLPDPTSIDRECREYAAADVVAVPSQSAASTFLTRGISPDRLAVNGYGVDVSRFQLPTTPRAAGKDVVVLFVGGVSLRKGIPWLLRAMTRLSRSVRLRLVGPIEPAIVRYLRDFRTDHLQIDGPLRGDLLTLAYQEADIFCLPSIEEGLPLAAIQAMAAGLPVIMSEAAGAAEIVTDGVEGLIVPGRDSDAIAEAISRLADDGPARIAMGQAAHRRVARGHRWSDYGERAVSSYRSILGLEASPPLSPVQPADASQVNYAGRRSSL